MKTMLSSAQDLTVTFRKLQIPSSSYSDVSSGYSTKPGATAQPMESSIYPSSKIYLEIVIVTSKGVGRYVLNGF